MTLTAPTNNDLVKEQQLVVKKQWLDHPETQRFIRLLEEEQSNILNKSMNLSTESPLDIQQITRNLIQAHNIKQIVKQIKKL